MTTIKQCPNVIEAELDKALLEQAGISSFIADENSGQVGYGAVLGGVRLQVQDADVARAQEILEKREGLTPLPDDFVPPEEPSS